MQDNDMLTTEDNNEPYQDCFIIARSRSGTTVLRSFLETHPRISCFGELFNEGYELSYYQYLRDRVGKNPNLVFPSRSHETFASYLGSLRDLAARTKASTDICVYDIKYALLRHLPAPWEGPFDEPNVLKIIKQRPVRFIFLVRKNYLRRELSNKLMLLRKKTYDDLSGKCHFWASDKPAQEYIQKVPRKIQLDAGAGRMIKRFEAYDDATRCLRRFLNDNTSCFELTYEELFERDARNSQIFHHAVVSSVAAFLGVSATGFDVEPRLLKATPQRLDELLENHEEIVVELKNTPYEWFLEETEVT